jgi:general secretion pathway protein J
MTSETRHGAGVFSSKKHATARAAATAKRWLGTSFRFYQNRTHSSGLAHSQAGFTIVELLVSLTILTLIIAFIPGTLRIGQRVWEVDRTFERREALSTFRRYVEQRLAEAMPFYLRDRTGGVRIEFAGEPGRLVFVAPAAAGPAGGGVYRFELMREDGAASQQPLVLRQSLYRIPDVAQARNDDAPLPAAVEQRSRSGVAGLSFRYFGAAEPQRPAQWQSQWTRPDSLPELVEISLSTGARAQTVQRTIVQLRLGPPR